MDISHADALTALMDSANRLAATAAESEHSDEGWTPATILGHVSDVDEQVWLARIHLMVDALHKGLPMPSLMWWEPDAQATELKYRDYSIEKSIARLYSTRTSIIQTLSGLTEEEWGASALHDTFGTLTVALLPEKILLHDEEHLESLR
ncbi:MAG TPA: DinB family protein [Candidatus Nanopelagicaceae bacterium]|jgi:hypothetical protein